MKIGSGVNGFWGISEVSQEYGMLETETSVGVVPGSDSSKM